MKNNNSTMKFGKNSRHLTTYFFFRKQNKIYIIRLINSDMIEKYFKIC